MRAFRWTLVLLFTFHAMAAVAQPNDCDDGVVHDDGTFENGYGSNSFFFTHYVMRIDPPGPTALLEDVCICWQRTSTDSTIFFDVLVWAADGPDGEPGTLLGTLETVSASGVQVQPRFYRYDLSELGLTIDQPVYIGPLWDSGDDEDFFICADENGPTTQPAFADTGILAGLSAPDTELGNVGAFPQYRNLGIRAVFSQPGQGGLADVAGLIVPGFEVEVAEPMGPTTFFAIRNTTDEALDVDVNYYGHRLTEEPLRTDTVELAAQQTRSVNIRADLTNLEVIEGFATGLVVVTESGSSTAPNLQGDFFRADFANDFAAGDRLVRPGDFCNLQEIRFVDFGSGARFRILLNRPPESGAPAFSFTAYDEAGNSLGGLEVETQDHVVVIDVADLVPDENFGTVVFDFTESSGGWVSAEYSAFGRFSLELNSACRDY